MKKRSRRINRNYRYLAIAIAISILINIGVHFLPVQATPRTTTEQQQVVTTPQDYRAAAEKAEAEAKQLFQQNAPERQIIAKCQEAAKLYRAAGDFKQEAYVLAISGRLNYLLGEYQKSLEDSKREVEIYRASDNKLKQGVTLNRIADIYNDLGDYQKALDTYNQTLLLYRDEPDPLFKALAFTRIAKVYTNLGETQKVIESYNQALKFWQAKGDVAQQIVIISQIGLFYVGTLGDYRKAYDYLKQIRADYPDLKLEESIYYRTLYLIISKGMGINLLNDLPIQTPNPSKTDNPNQQPNQTSDQNEIDTLEQSLKEARAEGQFVEEAFILMLLGTKYNSLGEYQKVYDFHNRRLQLTQMMDSHSDEAAALTDIAKIYNRWDKKQEALNFYNRALEIQYQTGNRPKEAETLKGIANVYTSLGAYPLSLDASNRALSLYRYMENRTGEGQILDNIADIYSLSKDYQQALNYYQQELSVRRAAGNRLGESLTLGDISRIYRLMGDYQKALDIANEMLLLSRTLKNDISEVTPFLVIGIIYLNAGNYQKALEFTQQALEIVQKTNNRILEAKSFSNLGEIYDALKQPQQAISSYQQALEIWRTLGSRVGEANTLYQISSIESDRGNLKEALNQVEAAIKIIESIRKEVASSDLRTSFFASKQDYYQLKIDILMRLHEKQPSKGYDALALQTSEESRARTLLETLIEARADIRQGVDSKLLETERTLQDKLDALEKRRLELLNGNHTPEQVTALEQENQSLLAQHQDIEARIRANSPRYAELTQPQPLTLVEIQQQVLDDNTLLLEYSLGKEHSYLWAVTKTGMTSYKLPKGEEIETAARQFYNLVTNPNYRIGERGQQDDRGGLVVIENPAKISETVAKFSRTLLHPVAKQLGQKRLLIVADGALQYVPFAALPIPDNKDSAPLLVEHEIVTLPSASTLAVNRRELNGRKPAPKTLAILADPVFSQNDDRVKSSIILKKDALSLPQEALDRASRESGVKFIRLIGTRQEAEQILQLIPTDESLQKFDFAANLPTATSSQLAQYRIVHFATHGILNTENPELSGIVLSLVDETGALENGFLRLHEIYNLNLPAELVVLSACQTGLGQEIKGEGLVGLTRGFMYAGTPRIVVSLWSVNDIATSELMVKFYRGILEKGLQPAAALRAAQLEMWQQPQQSQWKAPYYWAAFTLQGEWN